MLNLPICEKTQGEENLKILFGDTFPKTDCDCLDPCSQDVYKFQVSRVTICKLIIILFVCILRTASHCVKTMTKAYFFLSYRDT